NLAGLQLSSYGFEPFISKFDLTLDAREEQGVLQLGFEYSTELFAGQTIDRMIGYFKQIVSSVTADADVELSSIGLLSASEEELLLEKFNATARSYPAAE